MCVIIARTCELRVTMASRHQPVQQPHTRVPHLQDHGSKRATRGVGHAMAGPGGLRRSARLRAQRRAGAAELHRQAAHCRRRFAARLEAAGGVGAVG
jgi:hypothetical protein